MTESAEPSQPTAASLLAMVDSDQLMRDLVERLLSGLPRYTPEEISSSAGVERDVSKKLWRAMGLADVPDDDVAFTDFDLRALERAKALLGRDEIQMHLIVQLARTLGLATARIADSIVDFTLDRLVADLATAGRGSTAIGGPVGAPGAGSDEEQLRQPVASDHAADLPLVGLLLGELDELVVYLLHRHLVDATARRLATVGEGATSSQQMVGFADLVGYTALSQELADEEIVDMVDRFEALASNEVVGAGGRIIKIIGDEVMFSASDDAGPEIALRLAEAFAEPDLPKIRVGLASGSVLSRSGDLYGPVVNLAARATAIAHPSTVVVAPSVRDLLADDDRYALRRLRPRRLKGIGFVELFALRRSKAA